MVSTLSGGVSVLADVGEMVPPWYLARVVERNEVLEGVPHSPWWITTRWIVDAGIVLCYLDNQGDGWEGKTRGRERSR